jgi:DNA polymerase III epsilon subunit-like protein
VDKKVFHFDCETTGRFAFTNEITQLAVIIEINKQEVETRQWLIRPTKPGTIQAEAIKVTGVSIEELMTYPEAAVQYKSIIAFLDGYINKFNKTDKFTPAGFAVQFDCDFMRSFFAMNNNNFYGSYFNNQPIDPLQVIYFLVYSGKFPRLPNYKLKTVCDFLGIEIDAHDAFSDIRATHTLIQVLDIMMQDIT